ncbi:MAG: hypothetical protein JW795_12970 [Chitinivibrionales bacterium]|nr:hypothetical protein [Chitinivibrionales bacterium]
MYPKKMILLLLSVISLVCSEEIRATFYTFTPISFTDSRDSPTLAKIHSNLSYFKELGYNTMFEFISPLWFNASWETASADQWNMEPIAREKTINYIRTQKTLMTEHGIEYCPFYTEWGWGANAWIISQRSAASQYRIVSYDTTIIGQNVLLHLRKNASYNHYTESILPLSDGSHTWFRNFDSLLLYSNSRSSRHVTIEYPFNNRIKTNTCYAFSLTLHLAQSNLQVGDIISLELYRQLKKIISDRKPQKNILNSNRYVLLGGFTAVYLGKTGTRHRFRQEYTDKVFTTDSEIFALRDSAWIDEGCVTDSTMHYTDMVRFDISVKSTTPDRESICSFSQLSMTALDPFALLAYPAWEKMKKYEDYLRAYPDEKFFQTIVTGRVNRTTTALSTVAYRNLSEEFVPATIQGHFRVLHEGCGLPHFRFPTDPLSPATMLITAEMARIIKQGMVGKEPKYWFISSDEVLVSRLDAVTAKGAPTVYGAMSNTEFFAEVVHRYTTYFKQHYCGADDAKTSTRFIAWGDPFLPCKEMWYTYAEDIAEVKGLRHLAKISGQEPVSLALWSYDYCKNYYWNKGSFQLLKTAEIGEALNRCYRTGITFIATFATDGSSQRIGKSGLDHIDHEIFCSRQWQTLIDRNKNIFIGYLCPTWTRNSTFTFDFNWSNGLFLQSYFGWRHPATKDFPLELKKFVLDKDGEPVLKALLMRR